MELRIFTEPQNGASYDDQLAHAVASEKLGFGAWFRSDHFLTMEADGLPGPTDSWTTLAGLARETSTIRLGTLVSSATFRLPGVLAIQVAQVDQMSGGRVEFGLGAGWFADEHSAYGIPFPTKRFGLLEEQLEIITGLWATPVGQRFDFSGEHYEVVDSPALPKPVQQGIPVIVGGRGPKRTPALAARFATEYNSWVEAPEATAGRIAAVGAACEEIGRDASTMVFSVAGTTAVGASESEIERRATKAETTPEALRADGFAGTASEVVDRLGALRAVGVERVYLQVRDFHDLDQLDYIAREIVPQLR